jgi:hypothetical protein
MLANPVAATASASHAMRASRSAGSAAIAVGVSAPRGAARASAIAHERREQVAPDRNRLRCAQAEQRNERGVGGETAERRAGAVHAVEHADVPRDARQLGTDDEAHQQCNVPPISSVITSTGSAAHA